VDTLSHACPLKTNDVTTEERYCGPPGLKLRQFLRANAREDDWPWINGGKSFFVHKARTAIRHLRTLLKCAPGDEILAPAYNCGTEIDALLVGGFRVVPYRVDRAGMVDLEDLQRGRSIRTRAVYLIHYFGFPQSLDKIREWCNQQGLFLVEDCALALFSADRGTRLGTIGDLAVFSLPKTLPVPDGGILLINNPDLDTNTWRLQEPEMLRVIRGLLPVAKSTFLRRMSGLSPMYAGLRDLFRRTTGRESKPNMIETDQFPDMPSDYYFDAAFADKAISGMTLRLLRTFSSAAVRERRRENFLRILQMLSGTAGAVPLYADLPEGVCPLWFPVLVDDPGRVCRSLQGKSVNSIAWWSGFHRTFSWEDFPEACYLKKHILALPVHQDLGPQEIEHVCCSFLEILEGRA